VGLAEAAAKNALRRCSCLLEEGVTVVGSSPPPPPPSSAGSIREGERAHYSHLLQLYRHPKHKSRHPKHKSRHPKYKSRHPKYTCRHPKYKSRRPKYKPLTRISPTGPVGGWLRLSLEHSWQPKVAQEMWLPSGGGCGGCWVVAKEFPRPKQGSFWRGSHVPNVGLGWVPTSPEFL